MQLLTIVNSKKLKRERIETLYQQREKGHIIHLLTAESRQVKVHYVSSKMPRLNISRPLTWISSEGGVSSGQVQANQGRG